MLRNHDRPPGSHAGDDADNPFLTRLRLLTALGEVELVALERLCEHPRHIRARTNLTTLGDRAQRLHILLDGWACRFSLMSDGRRQITSLLIPGDVCDLDSIYFRDNDFAVATLTPCVVARVSIPAVRDLAARYQTIAAVLSWLGAVENAMLAERNAGLGRRSAREHLAHLICEMAIRLSIVGQGGPNGFTLPVTQEEIADTFGLTAVHVNRVLQTLRADGLIAQQGHSLVIRDWSALCRAAGFSTDYLHLEGMDDAGSTALPGSGTPTGKLRNRRWLTPPMPNGICSPDRRPPDREAEVYLRPVRSIRCWPRQHRSTSSSRKCGIDSATSSRLPNRWSTRHFATACRSIALARH